MHRVFQTFMDRLNESRDAASFQHAMANAAQAFDLPCFAYLSMPRDGRAVAALISSYPVGWTQHYPRIVPRSDLLLIQNNPKVGRPTFPDAVSC